METSCCILTTHFSSRTLSYIYAEAENMHELIKPSASAFQVWSIRVPTRASSNIPKTSSLQRTNQPRSTARPRASRRRWSRGIATDFRSWRRTRIPPLIGCYFRVASCSSCASYTTKIVARMLAFITAMQQIRRPKLASSARTQLWRSPVGVTTAQCGSPSDRYRYVWRREVTHYVVLPKWPESDCRGRLKTVNFVYVWGFEW